ncbi:SPARC-related modular calcium-binding protein 2 [Galemys pyrenaicus]|uniref:SPARC-related modular calcium-binding protein 2 n=1 Tax=Galemys pyrenaicus TaxID=202257 RepID=A0A8J5ZDQ0_GALPY|nr:SPARC-related modular calcium-binding protein 2 [Galemys pyrenaicus]
MARGSGEGHWAAAVSRLGCGGRAGEPQTPLRPAVGGGPAPASVAGNFLRVDQDKDKDCSLDCGGSPQKPLCASDGRTFSSRCEFQRAKCKDPRLEVAHRGGCRARAVSADVSRCVAERKYTQEQARRELQQVFIPECREDGTYSQVQCHSYTGYCWCVTPSGRPISGTAVAHKTPRCPGSVSEKLPQREGAGRAEDASAPALETQPQGDEEDIASRYPTLWTEQVKSRQNKTSKSAGERSRSHPGELPAPVRCTPGARHRGPGGTSEQLSRPEAGVWPSHGPSRRRWALAVTLVAALHPAPSSLPRPPGAPLEVARAGRLAGGLSALGVSPSAAHPGSGPSRAELKVQCWFCQRAQQPGWRGHGHCSGLGRLWGRLCGRLCGDPPD